MFLAFLLGTLLWWVMAIPATFLLGIAIFSIRKIGKTLRLYRKDAESGIKVMMQTKVLDKQHHSGSGKSCFIKTDLGRYNVSRPLYEVIKGQEDAIISVGKHSGWLIDVRTKSLEDNRR